MAFKGGSEFKKVGEVAVREVVDRKAVLILSQYYPPAIGGAESQLMAIAGRMGAAGTPVTVITRDVGSPPPGQVGVQVVRVKAHARFGLSSLKYLVKALQYGLKYRRQFGAVLCSQLGTTALVGYMLLRLAGLPYLIRIGGGSKGDGRSEVKRQIDRPVVGRLFWILLRSAHRIIAVSRPILRECTAVGLEEHATFIPNGVDTDRFSSAEHVKYRARLSLPETVTVVAYVGRLEWIKGVDLLPQVMAHLRNRGVVVHWLIVGDGPCRTLFDTLPDCHMTGAVTDSAPYLKAADVLVLPSRYEGMSNVLLESMSCGLAIVATSVGGTPDVVTNDSTGLLVDAENAAAIADAVEKAAKDKSLRVRLGNSARKHVVSQFSLDHTVSRYTEIIQSVHRG